jgi:hypothetical protein
MEKAEFQLMLAAIADLYLTAHVLILLDGSYASRFWTLMEAWCSMQTVTSDGLRPATEAERRYTIKCIHNATDEHDAQGLVDKVSEKTCISQQPFATPSRKVSGPSAPPKPRLQPSNQPFRWAGAWRFAYEIAFTNMDFFVDQDASIFNLPEDAPWGIWVSLTLGGRISELVNG